MSLVEKMLICRDCNQSFVFSTGEQEFFLLKGLKNEPKRCANCRLVMRVQRNGDDINRTCEVPCANCSIPTRVPFKPKGYRPVYCVGCFQIKKKEEALEVQESVVSIEVPQVALV
ncbi:MAG: zinc-ribbon domain containing protein [Candidatus Obscuribacterales bacterium]|jgi:CxxC-x17-CxxC domain-containing protein|nr:zinc-ribbon domain containing protein [Candidatus Obscuribacterales bacterium]